MTPVSERQAGYELDREVLEKVMGGGMVKRSHPGKSLATAFYDAGYAFSRDDAAAMRVVDEMVRQGFWPTIGMIQHRTVWRVAFELHGRIDSGRFPATPAVGRVASDHPDRRVAICLAALQAVSAAESERKNADGSAVTEHPITATENPGEGDR